VNVLRSRIDYFIIAPDLETGLKYVAKLTSINAFSVIAYTMANQKEERRVVPFSHVIAATHLNATVTIISKISLYKWEWRSGLRQGSLGSLKLFLSLMM